jgi:hypothetical protein
MQGRKTVVLVTILAVGSCCLEGPKMAGGSACVVKAAAQAAPARSPRTPGTATPRPAPHLGPFSSTRRASGVAYQRRTLALATAHVVVVDLNRPDIRVTVGLARGGIGRCEPWKRIIHRLRPTAAITGTYYDTATFVPVGTIVANGAALHRGSVGTALTFTTGNQARFTQRRLAPSAPGVHTALHAGPRLIDQGRVSLAPAAEGFRDPGIFVRKARAAVGLTKQNKLLLVAVTKPLHLREMARVMQELGAVHAMCMDGGSSTGLYCAGRSYHAPRRVMTNVLLVYAAPPALPHSEKA